MSFSVKRYIIKPNNVSRWLVIGTSKEYLVTPYSCTCKDFFIKITKKEKSICKHIALLNDAMKTNEFDSYEISIQEFKKLRQFLFEIKK
jgi:predicted nucleic acid-binding Zn finger protein